MRALLPPLLLLGTKILLGYVIRGETVEILEEKQVAEQAAEEVEVQYERIGAGIQLVEERTEKLEGKMKRTKKEFEEHQKRLTELRSMNLGLLTGERQTLRSFAKILGEIRNVMKRNEGVQISVAHSCLFGTPNWAGIIAYIEKLFSRKKTSRSPTLVII